MEHPRISQDPGVMVGKPVVKGTRITLQLIMELTNNGWSVDFILDQYPHLTREDVVAAQAYAADKRVVTAAERRAAAGR